MTDSFQNSNITGVGDGPEIGEPLSPELNRPVDSNLKQSSANFEVCSNRTDEEPDISDSLLKSPYIPEEIYVLLPEVLSKGLASYHSPRERDVFLTGAITILSGIFPTVSGIYDNKIVYPNLFSFVVAPAASGKSALLGAKGLVSAINKRVISGPGYDLATAETPALHQIRRLFLPGNISSAALISQLNENNGIGIICETEADSLSHCIKQDWGGFSDLLRKAFHHEEISYARKKDNEFINIQNPKLSVCLSGTPGQLPTLIKSVEDGLFSRFIFYIFRSELKWKDVSPSNTPDDYTKYLESLQEQIRELYDHFKLDEYTFDLSPMQWEMLNKHYEKVLKETVTFTAEESASLVMRLGLMHYRIAMVLSVLRHFENKSVGLNIACTEIDFGIAEILCGTYLDHAMLGLRILSKSPDLNIKGSIREFYKNLPIIPFKRGDAVKIGAKLKIAERTVNKYLKNFREGGYIKQEGPQGTYVKV